MEFLLLAATLLFLPGLAITYILGLDRYRYLLSFSLSYSIFVLLLKSTSLINIGMKSFIYAYLLLIFLLVLIASIQYYRHSHNKISNENVCGAGCYGTNGFTRLVPGLIVFALAIYYSFAGAYNELPSDIFQHLEFMQESSRRIASSMESGYSLKGTTLAENGKYWHYLYSILTLWAGSSIQASIVPASFFNAAVFLLGVYFFSQVVFREMHDSTKLLIFTSSATVIFTFFHFGINIFSFIRYYAIAPAILNLVLYFTVMAIVIDFFRDEKWNFKYLFAAGIIFYAAMFIHRQEALFAVLMVCIMSFYLFVQKHLPTLKLLWNGQGKTIKISPAKILTDKVNLSFLLTQTVMVSLFIYSYLSVARHPVDQPKIIPLENIFPFLKNLYILNPSYQFYYVVTLWGAAVIVLFILNIRKFSNNAFIMAGMLSPFFTIFNPFFTDLFLRHSYTVTLWRVSFLVPLHLVAAYLFVIAIQYIGTGSYLKKVYAGISVLLLVILLFPFQTTFLDNRYSRLLTLKPVQLDNSPEYWRDLLDYLNGMDERKRIITDPVTGYMVTALTSHISPRAKFHRRWGGYIKFNYDDYSRNPFDHFKGHLFIINKRNGGMSETGRVARHWPEGILQIENYYYSENLEDYVSSNPDRFRLLWEKDRIRVYSLDVPEK